MNVDLFLQKFNTALHLQCNFAAIRLPGSADTYFFYASEQPRMQSIKYQPTDKPLFFCSPYSAGNKAYTLEADAVFKNEACVYGKLPEVDTVKGSWPQGTQPENFYADEAFYCNYIRNIISGIEADQFDKVVAARCEKLNYDEKIEPAKLFHHACQKYPDACVYFFSINGIGSWIGASPETLLSLQHQTLSTVALAGTSPAGAIDAWTDKEYDEQAMTAFFIAEVLKENGIKKFAVSEVETVVAGAVQHLCSRFTVKLNQPQLEAKFHKILNALNPTPAVCGLPQFEASLFIAMNEKMERRFYTGFIGMQLPQHEIALFVNLRCAELFEQHALLYIGGGITAGSNEASEWQETVRKFSTIGSLLKPSLQVP